MMPIMPTPITPSGELDEASQRRLVQYCLKCNAAAIGHFGFASEFHKISNRMRRRATEIIIEEVNGKVPVFLGVTAPGLNGTLDFAREAEDMGADLLMAMLPYVFLPNAQGAFDFYKAIGETSSLPIIIQDVPDTSAILSPDLIARIADAVPTVLHVKAEGKNFIQKSQQLMNLLGDRVSVIGGAGGRHLIHLLRLGVTAYMTGTEALHLHGGCVKAYLDGDAERASRIYFDQIMPYLAFYLDYSEELLKAMLHDLGVIDCPKVLDPPASAPMTEIEWQEFNWVLDQIDWRRTWPDIP